MPCGWIQLTCRVLRQFLYSSCQSRGAFVITSSVTLTGAPSTTPRRLAASSPLRTRATIVSRSISAISANAASILRRAGLRQLFHLLFLVIQLRQLASQRARKFTVVERLAGIIPPAWFNLTTFHGVFAPNHAWREFVVPGLKTKRICPAHDEPNDSNPTPTGKPSHGRAPAE
jgi:hypothetical protein